jgi:hypothetical protein
MKRLILLGGVLWSLGLASCLGPATPFGIRLSAFAVLHPLFGIRCGIPPSPPHANDFPSIASGCTNRKWSW